MKPSRLWVEFLVTLETQSAVKELIIFLLEQILLILSRVISKRNIINSFNLVKILVLENAKRRCFTKLVYLHVVSEYTIDTHADFVHLSIE